MKKHQQKIKEEFKFNWKNTLAIWLVIVFFTMFIGFRLKVGERSDREESDINQQNNSQLEKDRSLENPLFNEQD